MNTPAPTMSTQTNDTPAPQPPHWAKIAAQEIYFMDTADFGGMSDDEIPRLAAIIARHAPQPNVRNVEESLICHANFKRGDAMTAAVAEKIINTLYQ